MEVEGTIEQLCKVPVELKTAEPDPETTEILAEITSYVPTEEKVPVVVATTVGAELNRTGMSWPQSEASEKLREPINSAKTYTHLITLSISRSR